MGSVLIVDDNSADRALLRTILGRAGYSVYEVARGREALQKTRLVRPHVVILDVNLPDLNGLEVCRAIRADREIAHVPVLMLTVRHDDSDVQLLGSCRKRRGGPHGHDGGDQSLCGDASWIHYSCRYRAVENQHRYGYL